MEKEKAKAIIENVLFVSDGPVRGARLVSLFADVFGEEEITTLLHELQEEYEASRALEITEVAEGWRIQTRATYAEWLTTFFKMEKGRLLGRAALEVLSIIAYRQPITRAEIDEIRGVDSGAAARGLIDKNLVKSMGRRKAPGKPMMYGTTHRFLEYFGLAKLSDLPTMEEFAEEMADLPGATTQESLALDGKAESLDDISNGSLQNGAIPAQGGDEEIEESLDELADSTLELAEGEGDDDISPSIDDIAEDFDEGVTAPDENASDQSAEGPAVA